MKDAFDDIKDTLSWMVVVLAVLVVAGVGFLLWYGFADLFRWQNPF